MSNFDYLGDMKKINPYVNQYADVDKYIDTGSYALNALLSGSIYKGLPGNKVTALAGETSTGKTFFLLGMVRQFIEDHPDGGVVLFESESATTSSMLEERGIDSDQVALFPVSTIEEFRTQAMTVLKKIEEIPEKDRKPTLMCLDSLGQLSTRKEVEDVTSGNEKRDMTRAPMIKGAFRVLTIQLGKLGIPLIVTNHTYDSIGSLYPTKELSGGSGLKYSADSIVFLSRRKEKDGTDVVGNVIHCRNYKSRLTKENKMVDVLLRYDTGLNTHYGMVDMAVDCGIWNRVSTRIELSDGKKLYSKNIMENPDEYFTKEVLDAIDLHAQKVFLYGSAQEENEEDENVGEE